MRPLFLSIAFVSLSAFAAPSQLVPRIVKVNATGYVAPEASRIETCEVYSDHVTITRKYGEQMVQKERHPVQVSNLKESILASINEQVTSTPAAMCDGPTTTTSAEILGSSLQTLVLFQSGECGRPRLFRDGFNSQNLRDIVDTYCPVTHDPQEEGARNSTAY